MCNRESQNISIHFDGNCNWCIPAVDNWGINAMAVVPLVLPWLAITPLAG